MTGPLALAALMALLQPQPAAADFRPIDSRRVFVAEVADRTLIAAVLGLSVRMEASGRIRGTAQGREVVGRWTWEGGEFCRTLRWEGGNWPRNCQLVEIDGDKVRLTANGGDGSSVVFNLGD
ncbi:hypothetical protein OG2516_10241 [Oceanicola granulosus HTCC2516]|uniref:Dihydrodipicolinate reductase n=1 Tax=Oceanicola granulosus (strain ATCC BAA-861 / DSM 15982 / KCTC 12143 / HTCC2516) TaxID=314256 RepID=Q2CKF5_OCEGH|nr:hypothetical protein [Oceanicola granulosus]EAR52834.1 hypothetical protein OG2516_10241 [Oceanicola granulosus HTCC2516]